MLQLGDRFGLGAEAGLQGGIGMLARQQDFQGHDAIERQMPGTVDDPHAAAAQFAENLIAGDLDRRRGVCEAAIVSPNPGIVVAGSAARLFGGSTGMKRILTRQRTCGAP